MVTLLLLVLFLSPQQISKVVVNTGVPAAEFYLDATFVAVTDENGSITMEGFPAGTFSFIIKKRGYKTYTGSFTIHEGESRRIQPVLEKLEASPALEEHVSKPQRSVRQIGHRSSTRGSAQPVASAAPSFESPGSPPRESVSGTPAEQPRRENNGEFPALRLAAALIAAILLVTGFRIWRRKRNAVPAPLPEEVPDTEGTEASVSGTVRPEPLFIEELRRREEQLNAGLVGNKPPSVDPESMKDREIVIVLPKEAYRYEEDK